MSLTSMRVLYVSYFKLAFKVERRSWLLVVGRFSPRKRCKSHAAKS
jgi:hypothetical protein